MLYRIRYAKAGKPIGSTDWSDSFADTLKLANEGMIRHRAEDAPFTGDPIVWTRS